VFRSTRAEEDGAEEDAAEEDREADCFSERVSAAEDFVAVCSDLGFFSVASLGAVFEPPLTVTSDEILSIVADDTPARERSATEA
jgi:hypothetical protein